MCIYILCVYMCVCVYKFQEVFKSYFMTRFVIFICQNEEMALAMSFMSGCII